jgi:ATP-dependent Lon protease
MTDTKEAIYPLLPLRDIVVFPEMVAPLFVGRERSISALEYTIRQNTQILLLTQKDAAVDNPAPSDLYEVGVLANVLQLLKLPDGTVKVLVEGKKRVQVKRFVEGSDYHNVEIEELEEVYGSPEDTKALVRSLLNQFTDYTKLNTKISHEVVSALSQITDPSMLADTMASHLNIEIQKKQVLLETDDINMRLERIYSLLEGEIEILDAERKIRSRVKGQMEKTQREYYLNEQLKAIHKELGDAEDGKNEIVELEEKINKTKFSKEAAEKAKSELKKLKNMAPMSAEATVVRNYLDWLLTIPWQNRKRTKQDLNAAEAVLDKDHYGLEKVKERILEFLAVQKRTKKLKGPILCLVGPPGVGKTSLARSIATAVGREFVKISLGGVRDESEIRGHRRTYIGSMPGKLIQSMKKSKFSNPLILLDEIDKMGIDFRGDPASALLEVLDPEQNAAFNDHYLEVEYDLSDVMFVTTANSLDMPHALLDRLEVIRIAGYTEDEKIEIAKRHLVNKQCGNSGLKKGEWSITDSALKDVVRYYTREAGVRNLERELAKLTRKATREIVLKKQESIEVTPKNLEKYAGVRRFNYGQTNDEDMVGVVTGLAYTEYGGDLLAIEAVKLPGKGDIKCTGKLGEVMQESAQAAYSYAKSQSTTFGITPKEYQKRDIHIHVPEGATPKDGPSAGIGIYTSIVSVLTGIPVVKQVAMTGEITLTGRVLAIGGLKEKLLAALRGGVKVVVIPEENGKDLTEIPANVKKKLKIIQVSHAEEVLKIALQRMPESIDWVEGMDEVTVTQDSQSTEHAIKH